MEEAIMIDIFRKFQKKKKIIKIGIAYSFQKIQKIPINNYDIKLDCIITEKKIYK